MPKTPCHDAFNEAAKRRAAYPLPYGAYKLRNVLSWLSRMRCSMAEIGIYLNKPGNYAVGDTLGCCTTDDKAMWIKGIPTQVAHMLGHDIIPAIAALTGDGIPERYVANEVACAKCDATSLLNECEDQLARLKLGISGEYEMMKTGYSDVYGLLVSAEFIAEAALRLTDKLDARRA